MKEDYSGKFYIGLFVICVLAILSHIFIQSTPPPQWVVAFFSKIPFFIGAIVLILLGLFLSMIFKSSIKNMKYIMRQYKNVAILMLGLISILIGLITSRNNTTTHYYVYHPKNAKKIEITYSQANERFKDRALKEIEYDYELGLMYAISFFILFLLIFFTVIRKTKPNALDEIKDMPISRNQK